MTKVWKPSPIKQQDDLPTVVQCLAHGLTERLAQSPPTTAFSFRMSMISTTGIGRSPTRLGIASRVYRPRSALCQLSSDGVAEPRITGIRSMCARLTATSRA